jgi:hypothetical protein
LKVLALGVVVVLGAATAGSAAVPHLVVLHRSSQTAHGYIFIAPKTENGGARPTGPEIVDDRGRPVWFARMPPGTQAADFRVQSYQGRPVLTWWQGSDFGTGTGVGYVADASYRVIATVHAGNGLVMGGHEFTLTPQGTALITIYRELPYDLSAVGGPKDGTVLEGVVQEVDVATGRVLFEWHSLDHVPLDESYASVDPGEAYDFFHINAVSVDTDGNLLVSARHTWTIYKLDRHTGQVLWRLGGRHSDFALGPGVRFAWQHDPHPAGENTIRLFDNESNGPNRVMPSSRVVWIRLDPSAKTATLVKAVAHPGGLSAPSQGNAEGLADGHTFVGWGETGRISEFDSEGKLLFDAALPSQDTYRAYRAEWTGEPASAPTATARRNGKKTTIVHAIWNGATRVKSWRILAGAKSTKLARVRTVAWNGLDTTAKIPGVPRVVEVQGLDAQGTVIGTSKQVRPAYVVG